MGELARALRRREGRKEKRGRRRREQEAVDGVARWIYEELTKRQPFHHWVADAEEPESGQEQTGTIQVMFTNYASAEGTTAYSEADMFVQWQEWLDSNKNANKRLWQNAVKLNNRSQFAKALHEIFPTDTFQMKANQGNRKAGETDAEKRERLANVKVCLKFTEYDQLREAFASFVQTPSATVFPERTEIAGLVAPSS